MTLYFARSDYTGFPVAIFTGRFIFIEPGTYDVSELIREAERIRIGGLDDYLLTAQPTTEFEKTVYEENLHTWLNQRSIAYAYLTRLRRSVRWHWILRRDRRKVRHYYEARTWFFAIMNPQQERIASAVEKKLNYQLTRNDLDDMTAEIASLDKQFFSLLDTRLRFLTDIFQTKRALYPRIGRKINRPPCVVIVTSPPEDLKETNYVLGEGWFPSDDEIGYAGDWRTVFNAKKPLVAIFKRFRSPEFYRRNTFDDDLAWARIKFEVEEQLWNEVKPLLVQNGSTVSARFVDYKATILNFASTWAGLQSRAALVRLWNAVSLQGTSDARASQRFKKAVNFFYLHDN